MGWARAVTFLGAAVVITIVLVGGGSAQEHMQSHPNLGLLTTGHLSDVQAPTHNMTVAWKYESPTEMATVQPLVLETDERDRVLVATSNERNETGNIVALDASDGSPIWESEIGPILGWTPGPRGTQVFASVEGEGVVAWDATTGEERWNAPMEASSPPASGADHLYVGAGDEVVAVESQTGETVWTTGIQGGVVAERPAIANGTVFSVADDPDVGTGAVHALDARRGELLWTAEVDGLDERNRLQSPVPGNGLLYIAGYGQKTLAALDPGDGAELWKVITRAALPDSPSLAECNLFLARTSGALDFLNATDGEEGFTPLNGEQVPGFKLFENLDQRPVLTGGTLFLVDESGSLRVTDLTSLQRTFLHRMESAPVAPPTPHHHAVVQATEDAVTAFSGETPPSDALDVLDSCPHADDAARERASKIGEQTTRTPEEEGQFRRHGPGDDQPAGPSHERELLQNVSGGPLPASAEDGSGGASRTIPSVGLIHAALALGGLAAANRRR